MQTNNKLREALEKIRAIAKTFMDATQMRRVTDSARIDVGNIKDLADAALAEPVKNCDVGTAKEQDERFHRFCKCHRTGSCAGCHNPVGDYTVANGIRECALAWAQMPYEEGGAK